MAVTKNEPFNTTSVGTSQTYNTATNFTAGRNGFVLMSYYQFGGPPTLAVTIGGDTATLAAQGGPGVDRRQAYIWYVRNLTGGSTAVVISGMIAADGLAVGVLETDDNMPASPVDKTATLDTPTASPLVLTTAATAQANEFVVCVATGHDTGSSIGFGLPTTGYTQAQLYDPGLGLADVPSSSAYKYVSSTGAQSATWSFTSDTATGALATFKYTPASTTTLLAQACQ
jgi:hypothetical protein